MEKNIDVYKVTLTVTSVSVSILGYELHEKRCTRSNLAKNFERIVREIESAVEENIFWRCTGYRRVKTFLVTTIDGSPDEYVVAYNKTTAILLAKKYHPEKQFNEDPDTVWTCQ